MKTTLVVVLLFIGLVAARRGVSRKRENEDVNGKPPKPDRPEGRPPCGPPVPKKVLSAIGSICGELGPEEVVEEIETISESRRETVDQAEGEEDVTDAFAVLCDFARKIKAQKGSREGEGKGEPPEKPEGEDADAPAVEKRETETDEVDILHEVLGFVEKLHKDSGKLLHEVFGDKSEVDRPEKPEKPEKPHGPRPEKPDGEKPEKPEFEEEETTEEEETPVEQPERRSQRYRRLEEILRKYL